MPSNPRQYLGKDDLSYIINRYSGGGDEVRGLNNGATPTDSSVGPANRVPRQLANNAEIIQENLVTEFLPFFAGAVANENLKADVVYTVASGLTVVLPNSAANNKATGISGNDFTTGSLSSGDKVRLKKTGSGTVSVTNGDNIASGETDVIYTWDGTSWSKEQSVPYFSPDIPNASTTTRGIVGLATNGETQSGSDSQRAVTPSGLSSRTSTTSRTGLVELATNSEIDVGDDTARAVTPAGVRRALTSGGSITSDALAEALRPIGTQKLWLPAPTWFEKSGAGATAAVYAQSDARPDIPVFRFTTSDRYIQTSVAMPKGWDEGTLTFRVRMTRNNTGAGDVVMGLRAVAFGHNDRIWQTDFGSEIRVVATFSGSNSYDHVVSPVSNKLTVGGSPAENGIVFFRLGRVNSDSADTKSGEAALIGVEIFYTTNRANED